MRETGYNNFEMSLDSRELGFRKLNLSQCRCCTKSDKLGNMRLIYDRSNKQIADMFCKYTSLELARDDGLPEEICTACLHTFIQFHEFCVMCSKSDTLFREQKRLKDMVKIEQNDESQINADVESDPIKIEPMKSESYCELGRLDMEKDDHLDEEEVLDSEEHVNGDLDPIKTEPMKSESDCELNLDEDDDEIFDSEGPADDVKNNKPVSTTKSRIFPCPQCNKKFYRERRLEGHLRQHQGLKPAVCGICGKEFSKWTALDTHIMYWHNKAERKFICDEPGCEKSYIMKQSLTTHKKRAHSNNPSLKPESCYICELCGKSFATIATLKKHSFIHSGQRPFICTLCPKKYITNHKLKEHMMRHEGIKNFVCPECGMKKTTMHELKIHMNYHTREKLYPCKACPAVFSSPGNRGRHFNIVHCGIKAYQCTYCERSFGKAETLKHHEMTHTGEKPHGCTLCGKRFIQLVALQAHMKTHNRSR